MDAVPPAPATLPAFNVVHEQRNASSETRQHPTSASTSTSTYISPLHHPALSSQPTTLDTHSALPPQAAMNPVQAHLPSSNPASQDSADSEYPGTVTSAPGLQSSSSNLSISTVPESAFTSPASSIGVKQFNVPIAQREAAMAAAVQLSNVQSASMGRVRTPDPCMALNSQSADTGTGAADSLAAETPYLQPLHQASKRTASGTVKPSFSNTVTSATSPPKLAFGHSRSSSALDGASRQRISELSAQLKTRLSYAMVKVQHGWENRSLDELEQSVPASAAPARLPMTPTSTNRTPRHLSRPSISSNISITKAYGPPYTDRPERYALSPDACTAQSPASHPALLRRTISSSSGEERPASDSARTYASFWAQHERGPIPNADSVCHHAHNSSTSTITGVAPSLAPAADLVSTASKRRSQHGRAAPRLSTAGERTTPKRELMTPKTPRQGILRMPSQQAEKDAVDTLLFMSSPNNSSNMKHAKQHGSPLRSEFPASLRG